MPRLLQEGDIIEIVAGHTVNADIPRHFAFESCKGDFTITRATAVVGGELSYLAARYVVYKTCLEDGHAFPAAHHVYCERLSNPGLKLDFYQAEGYIPKILDITPVGRAERRWVEPGGSGPPRIV